MNTVKLNTALPYFMGFYETVISPEPDCYSDVENLSGKELREHYPKEYKKFLKAKKEDKSIKFGEWLCDHCGHFYSGLTWSEFTTLVCKNYVNQFDLMLFESGLKEDLGIVDLVFESMHSPKEYNFTTDRVFADITLDKDKFVSKILSIFESEPEITKQVLDRYFKSRDGFASFTPHDLGYWAEKVSNIGSCNYNDLEAIIDIAITVVYNTTERSYKSKGLESIFDVVNTEIEYYIEDYDCLLPR